MKIIFLVGLLSAQSYIPESYMRDARGYYAALDSEQWVDVSYHIKYFGYEQAVIAGLEGSNREQGKHPSEGTYQCVGVSLDTALLKFPNCPEFLMVWILKLSFAQEVLVCFFLYF